MVICPKCGNKIPGWKMMFLTNFNTITCPTCSTKLQVKNKGTSSLIGGIGGGVGGALGGLLLYYWLFTKEVFCLSLLIALFSSIAFAAWLAAIKFIKLK